MNLANPHHPLDHLVLPVSDLASARARLTALGFTVAPDGIHPFGTANCCVYFGDGVFIEPLALADAGIADEAARSGNTFVRHFLDYRAANLREGFSALVFGTDDAAADHSRYREKGISAGDMVTFGRDFVTADGARDRAEFKLAFALDAVAPDCLFFACERVAVPKVDRSALQRHANGVTGISGVHMTADRPENLVDMLGGASGTVPHMRTDGALALRIGDFELLAVQPERLAGDLGLSPEEMSGPQFRAITFTVDDVAAAGAVLQRNAVAFHRSDSALVVPPASGQGAAFIFASKDA